MKRLLKVTKYQLFDTRMPVAIYLLVVFVLIGLSIIGNGRMAGMDFATTTFLFVVGMNSFKSHFKFFQANNVTRLSQFLGSLIAFTCIALYMALVDIMITLILKQFLMYQNMYMMAYKTNYLLNTLWSFMLYLALLCIGYFITMAYYKSNTTVKIIISLFPVLLFFILTYGSTQIFYLILGLIEYVRENPYNGILIYLLSFILVSVLNYLLIRRMTLKE